MRLFKRKKYTVRDYMEEWAREQFKVSDPRYLCLKLQRQLDVVKLRNMINDLIDGDNAIGISMKWLDLAEILLKADGSWEKKPFLYNKYFIIKEGK